MKLEHEHTTDHDFVDPLVRRRMQTNSLVVDVLSLAVDLVDQRKVKVEAFDSFSVKHSNLGLKLLVLHVLYHIREPNSQPVVANVQKELKRQNQTECRSSFI